MTAVDDLLEELQSRYNRFLVDQFSSTQRLVEVVTQSGSVTKELFQVKLQTGIEANSAAKIYYDLNIFNPHYSKAYFRVKLDSAADVFAFVGFKKSFSDPAFNDVASHSAVMLYNGNLYLSTGNELGVVAGYQNTQVSGVDVTRDFVFKIEKNRLSTMPLPQIIPYFDTFRIIASDRVWSLRVTNSTSPPEDLTHYVVFFIKNSTNTNKVLTISSFMYEEEYAD